ncbi:ABC transporter permease [Microbacterium amylolyticum]|uniref:ABC-2 type transport system permease protein n=1 Tax=Microbacterium amylolyticum TaxID=936337 RepID=A0ABS4ZFY4_9MICO|nr:hypothetical protein [Microbacterium amylolyticum]MBP2436196.1 ABC-2 type transport system permease protein [Microbacterium amylolyticum]
MTVPVAIPVRARAGTYQRASRFTGTLRLLSFAIRRDRVRIAVWIGSLALTWLAFAAAFTELGGGDELDARALVMHSPAMVMMTGPGYGLDNYTVGAAIAMESPLWIVGALSVMSILQIVRHTRAEEESGRAELLRAAPLGRYAQPAAALLLVLLMHLAITIVSVTILVGAAEVDLASTVALITGLALIGCVFAGVALIAAQLAEHARTATGVSLAVFGAAAALRAIGDARESPALGSDATSWISWLSPIAWAQQTRAYVDLRWWPLGLIAAAAILTIAVAAVLIARRDFGAGLIPSRPGRVRATPALVGPTSLAWRTQRMGLMWTTLALGLLWLGSGTIMGALEEMMGMLEEFPLYAAMLNTDDLAASFFTMLFLLVALGAASWAVASLHRLGAEEHSGRTEMALAGGVSRAAWLGGQIIVTTIGAAVIMITGQALLWAGAVLADAPGIPSVALFAEFAAWHLPALAIIIAFAAALHAWRPSLLPVAWIIIGWAAIVMMFADLLGLPDAARAASPFWWVPATLMGEGAAGGSVDATTAGAALSGGAGVLIVIALVTYRRRDIPA